MSEMSLSQKLILLMIRAKRHMHSVSESWNLAPMQATLLTMLEPNSPKTMNELAGMMVCDASNITGLIDRLESGGYIERTSDPKDRRIKVIQMTDKGLNCRNALLKALDSSGALGLNNLTDSEIKALHSVADKIAL
jgi:DNA-binding MarR family transcriptional regulator